MAVTNVSMALAYSPDEASATARAIALLETVLFLFMPSSKSASDRGGGPFMCLSEDPEP